MKKSGFTLIELLAVIVVLTIIALIATPLVYSIIRNVKYSSLKRSSANYINFTENIIIQTIFNDKIKIENGSYPIMEDGNICIGIKEENNCSGKELIITMNGLLPTGGWVAIVNNEIVWYDLVINNNNIPMEEYTSAKCFTFDKESGSISEYLCNEKEVIIPPTIDGIEVKSFGKTFFKTKINKIILPSTIDSIEYGAFQQSQLEEIIMPYSITSIGPYAFKSAKLKNIVLPYNATTFGLEVFNNNLLPEDQAFIYARNSDGSINYEQLVSYGGANKDVIIPKNIKVIQRTAFVNNNLTSVVIPTSVVSIHMGAFNNNLLPDDQAFIYAKNNDGSINYERLVSYGGANKDVKIPYGVKEIGAYSLNYIDSVEISNTVKIIEQYAFLNSKFESIEIPESVTYIQNNAFATNNNNLTTIYYKGSATGFPWGAKNATLISDY